MRQTIHRKDGITYERLVKDKNFDCNLNINYYTYKIDILKKIAKLEGTDYSKLIRDDLDKLIDKKIKQHNLTNL